MSDFTSDMIPYYLPAREFGFSELRLGHIPFWNPYVYSGAPFFADPQTALFYPLNWHFLFLTTKTAVNWGVACHVFLAGLFLYLWLAYRRFVPAACLLGATVFMLAGPHFLQVSQGHLSNLCALSWTPLIFLALDGWKDHRSARWLLLGIGAVSFQILAGHPQYVFYTLGGVLLYSVGHLAPIRRKITFLSGLAFFYLGAFCLTAIQLLTSWTAGRETLRGEGLSRKVASTFFLPVENILTLVMPHIFGGSASSAYWGRGTYSEACLFVGVLPFGLALLGFIMDKKGSRVDAWMVFISFFFALGSQTFLFNLSYDWIPFFRNFRGTGKFDFLTVLFLAVLAGSGLNRLMKKNKIPSLFPSFILGTGAFLLAIGFFLVLLPLNIREQFHLPSHSWFGMVESFCYFGGLSLFLALILVAIQKIRRKEILFLALAFFGVVELFVFARSHRPFFDIRQYEARKNALQSLSRAYPGDYRITTPFGDAGIQESFDLWGFNPMVLGRYAHLIAASQDMETVQIAGAVNIVKTPSLCLGLLRYRYQIHDEFSGLKIYPTRLKELQRAQFVDNFQVFGNEQQEVGEIMKIGFDPSKKIILESLPDPLPEKSTHAGTVQVSDLSTDLIDIRASLDHPSLLLISDNYARDWKINPLGIDRQKEYKVMPADLTLRAVPLSAGNHHFQMEYRPKSFDIGKTISEFSFLAFITSVFLVFRPQRWKRLD